MQVLCLYCRCPHEPKPSRPHYCDGCWWEKLTPEDRRRHLIDERIAKAQEKMAEAAEEQLSTYQRTVRRFMRFLKREQGRHGEGEEWKDR